METEQSVERTLVRRAPDERDVCNEIDEKISPLWKGFCRMGIQVGLNADVYPRDRVQRCLTHWFNEMVMSGDRQSFRSSMAVLQVLYVILRALGYTVTYSGYVHVSLCQFSKLMVRPVHRTVIQSSPDASPTETFALGSEIWGGTGAFDCTRCLWGHLLISDVLIHLSALFHVHLQFNRISTLQLTLLMESLHLSASPAPASLPNTIASLHLDEHIDQMHIDQMAEDESEEEEKHE